MKQMIESIFFYMQEQLLFKVLFLGPSKCGKTSFLQCLANQKYVQSQKYVQTIGVDFFIKKIQINQKSVKMQVWDTTGSQKYGSINKTYYKGTSIFVFMFDLSDLQSFQALKMRVKSPNFNEFIEFNTKNSKSPLTLLIGSKSDLQQKVPDFQIQKISKKFTLYMKTSSKTGENVENAIIKIAEIKVNDSSYEWNPNFDDQQQNLTVLQTNQLNIKSQQNAAPGSNQQEIVPIIIKLLLIGPQKSGKTSILHSYFGKVFEETYKPTIGVDYRMKFTTHKDKIYKIVLWDTSGQERFKPITTSLYKESSCIFIVYDCTNQNQFKHLSSYLKDIQQYADKPYVCLVGSKYDLADKKKISAEMGMQFAEQYQIDFMEVSSIPDQQNNTLNILVQRGIEWFYNNKQNSYKQLK